VPLEVRDGQYLVRYGFKQFPDGSDSNEPDLIPIARWKELCPASYRRAMSKYGEEQERTLEI
jgi:hypothetical protein